MARQKILIVDDSKTIRMQIRDMLPQGNFEVLEAQDGLEGLDTITQERPNLVLLDFFMPRMNGWEVVQKIQDHPKLKHIPVVMMSGRREDVEKAVPELFEYFEFLGKPFDPPTLLRAIKRATTKAKQRKEELEQRAAEEARCAAAEARTEEPSVPLPQEATSIPVSADAISQLHQEIQSLRADNALLKTEVEGLKKQMRQLLTFVRQRL